MALVDRLRTLRRLHFHRWVRVSNEGWVFASFLRNIGDRPPPLHIPGM